MVDVAAIRRAITPQTILISIMHANIEANTLLAEIQDHVAASAGAACHSGGDIKISAVLNAMKVPVDYAMGTIRLSTGRMTSEEEVDQAVSWITEAVMRLRS
jgi:cysteine desulfurase